MVLTQKTVGPGTGLHCWTQLLPFWCSALASVWLCVSSASVPSSRIKLQTLANTSLSSVVQQSSRAAVSPSLHFLPALYIETQDDATCHRMSPASLVGSRSRENSDAYVSAQTDRFSGSYGSPMLIAVFAV